jgi:hypothetical protein
MPKMPLEDTSQLPTGADVFIPISAAVMDERKKFGNVDHYIQGGNDEREKRESKLG